MAAQLALAALAGLTVIAGCSVSYGQFKMDMSKAQIRSAMSETVVADLAVGEEGIVSFPNLCISNGQLFINGSTSLSSQENDIETTYRVKHNPGGQYAITVTPAKKNGESLPEILKNTVQYGTSLECDFLKYQDAIALPVGSINGLTSASQVFGH